MPFDNFENERLRETTIIGQALLAALTQLPAMQSAREAAPILPPSTNGNYVFDEPGGEYLFVTYWKAGMPVASAPIRPEN